MEQSPTIVRVLFVCLGNICRSPMAQAAFQRLINDHNVQGSFLVESAGTSSAHEGEDFHPETQRVARQRELPLVGKSRPVEYDDLLCFDYVVAMDSENHAHLRNLDETDSHREKILLLRQFSRDFPGDLDVPDPYYGGPEGFDHVYEIVLDGCKGLLTYLTLRHGLRPYETE